LGQGVCNRLAWYRPTLWLARCRLLRRKRPPPEVALRLTRGAWADRRLPSSPISTSRHKKTPHSPSESGGAGGATPTPSPLPVAGQLASPGEGQGNAAAADTPVGRVGKVRGKKGIKTGERSAAA
jgi:hypothetical protein